jgi:beta-N-acetylhexosaminidase
VLRRAALLVIATLSVAALGAGGAFSADETSSPRVRVEASATAALPADAAATRVAAMSLTEKAASVVMGHIPTTDPAAAAAYMSERGLGGFILMGANIPADEGALRTLTAAMTPDAAFPPLLAVDQEGGDVSRLRWDALPAGRTLKAAAPEETRDAFAGRAALVGRAGIGVNFGVVADVTDDPGMFIYRRALGTDPSGAGERVAAAVVGEHGQAMSTLKHFPGHGAAAGDSHAGIPATGESLAEWRSSDAVPFAAGIDAGAELLMFGHLRYSAVDSAPASLSAEWHRIAREELGFTGVSVTDDLGMLQASGEAAYTDPVANAVAALAAGNDLVLSVMFTDAGTAGRIVDGIIAAVEAGTLPADRLDEAATRVAALRLAQADAGRAFRVCGDCPPVG